MKKWINPKTGHVVNDGDTVPIFDEPDYVELDESVTPPSGTVTKDKE